MNMDDDILPYDQYAEIEKSGITARPYVIEIGHEHQKLLFYGSVHSNNPEHPEFRDIEERWNGFVAKANKPIVFVEGRFDEVSKEATKDRNKSLIDGGEAQFVVYLARRDKAEVHSPEPDRTWEADELAKKFGRDNVIFYYFVRQIEWRNRLTVKPNIPAVAREMLVLMKDTYAWVDVEFSFEYMAAMHQHLIGRPLILDDAKGLYDLITPATTEHVTNQLACASGDLRDAYVLEQIIRYWKEGRSPFLVFGSSHAVRLEPALCKALAVDEQDEHDK